jgi:hypothetical protein
MVDYDGCTWGVILVREKDKKLFGEVEFEIKDTLSPGTLINRSHPASCRQRLDVGG